MSGEADSFPLSALQHYAFCTRQCALIHVERRWSENTLTAEGRVLHERAHEPGAESRGNVRIARGLPLQSSSLGVHGIADIVEFHRLSDGSWQPFPIEYKRGRPKHEPIDSIQLCAQAICLEEMMHVAVPAGALFYGKVHRRHAVVFDKPLRDQTRGLAAAVAKLVAAGDLPPADYLARCHSCSLFEICQPRTASQSASTYLRQLLASE